MLHIITPFSRPENLDFYIENLEGKNIIWHPIFHVNCFFTNVGWVESYHVFDLPENYHPNIYKLNCFIVSKIKSYEIVDEDYYMFMNDDDWMEESAIEEISKLDDDVIFGCMARGDNIPDNGSTPHGTSDLIPFKGVGVGGIGLEQIIVKGKVLKKMKFINDNMFDGLMATWLQENYEVKYSEKIWMLFNYLEEGRWNKKEEKQMETILDRFERVKREPRDINEHLNTLYTYATESGCDTIVELGTNEGISTTAWCLAVKNFPVKKLYCYDYIDIRPYFQELLNMCENERVEITFTHADSRFIEIPECDILFIDTLHVAEQIEEELRLHAPRTSKYIICHDTESFGETGVVPGSGGLKKPIEEFLIENKDEWQLKEHFQNNNGLTILERIK